MRPVLDGAAASMVTKIVEVDVDRMVVVGPVSVAAAAVEDALVA